MPWQGADAADRPRLVRALAAVSTPSAVNATLEFILTPECQLQVTRNSQGFCIRHPPEGSPSGYGGSMQCMGNDDEGSGFCISHPHHSHARNYPNPIPSPLS